MRQLCSTIGCLEKGLCKAEREVSADCLWPGSMWHGFLTQIQALQGNVSTCMQKRDVFVLESPSGVGFEVAQACGPNSKRGATAPLFFSYRANRVAAHL